MPWDPSIPNAALDVGDLAHLAVTFTDLDGVATDPTEVTLEIHEPDGTNTTVTWGAGQITRNSTGDFYYDFDVTQSGQHLYKWTASGALVGKDPGSFLVQPQQF
jgi:hypothetical protein